MKSTINYYPRSLQSKIPYVDLTKDTKLGDEKPLRVKIQKISGILTESTVANVSVGTSELKGIIKESALPKTGKIFEMFYYSVDGKQSYGECKLPDKIEIVVKKDEVIYFADRNNKYQLNIIRNDN